MILVLGIISVISCPLLGPIAWIMGKGDLEKIDRGLMDPEGRGLTQAGMVCGILGTVLVVLSLLGIVTVLVFTLAGTAMNS